MPALIAFLTSALKWVFSTLILKFFVFGIIFIAVTELVPVLLDVFLPEDIASLSGSIGGNAGFFLQPFHLDTGVRMMLSAYATRFLIRRIPFIG